MGVCICYLFEDFLEAAFENGLEFLEDFKARRRLGVGLIEFCVDFEDHEIKPLLEHFDIVPVGRYAELPVLLAFDLLAIELVLKQIHYEFLID